MHDVDRDRRAETQSRKKPQNSTGAILPSQDTLAAFGWWESLDSRTVRIVIPSCHYGDLPCAGDVSWDLSKAGSALSFRDGGIALLSTELRGQDSVWALLNLNRKDLEYVLRL